MATAVVNREHWMNLMVPHIREHFQAAGFEVPTNMRFTCGFPSKRPLGAKRRSIGECWPTSATTDQVHEICVSPVLADPMKVVGVQVHEVVHAVVGLDKKHGAGFALCAGRVGLVKPWTATTESDELKAAIKGWVDRVGPYPHGALTPLALAAKGEKGRMLLLSCECGLKVRSTQKWIDRYGEEWPCPCGEKLRATMESKDGEGK